MNWIERLYEIKNKDLYSQSGEGLILEFIDMNIEMRFPVDYIDIGGGNGFHLSNTRHLKHLGLHGYIIDIENGKRVTVENLPDYFRGQPKILSIDIDGIDYWILNDLFDSEMYPGVIVAEFNPAFTDARTIKYNPDHVWAGDDYYGFSFEAGKKLAEKHGYKVIFQLADMNMFMVRADLIEGLTFPEVTFKQNNFFKESKRTDWVYL